jgi:hypothetical protein
LFLPLALTLPTSFLFAAEGPVKASVVAVRESRVYMLAEPADSAALALGSRLTFLDRKKQVAHGTVIRSFEYGFAVAALTSGSLTKIKKLDRVKVLAEAPLSTRPTRMRVGLPSGRRPCAWFECPEPTLAAAGRIDTLENGTIRVLGAGTEWPDTLLVRRFDDVADQEIALERGDLDIGVFWPGELTPAARRNLNWDGTLAPLDRGTVFWFGAGTLGTDLIAPHGRTLFRDLNQQIFRGDLEVLTSVDPGLAAGFSVDASIPERNAIEAFLNRDLPASEQSSRIVFHDVAAPSSLVPGGGIPVFAMRCAVVIRPAWRGVLSPTDVVRLANLNQCAKDQP